MGHALAAAFWLGGGAYYVLAVRPQVRSLNDDMARSLAGQVQREFGEWALVATLVMIVTGVVLMFDRVSDGQGTAVYAVLLVIKIGAALAAFWLTGVFRGRRRRSRLQRTGYLDHAWVAVGSSTVAFLLGIVLSSLY